ncbi:glycosyltransferase [Thermogymnomonas acidicola]|uniref:glycosyltransferase n=1 Tax=Thermogymnomonas acidicola TaxID=399579 RepID=UPI001396C78A|nr:glycosyltransferase [Thermogymnomonas acidicola]
MLRFLQIAHGRIIPEYSSAYAMRCHSLLRGGQERRLVSVGGTVWRHQVSGYAEQFPSLLLMGGVAVARGNRSMEILISDGRYVNRRYIGRVKSLIRDSDVVVFEGPWQYRLFREELEGGKTVVYDAHNLEANLRKGGNVYHDRVREIEGEISRNADVILVFSREEVDEFRAYYGGVNSSKVRYVPHLEDLSGHPWAGKGSRDLVFIGSVYQPNIEALRIVEALAREMPDARFHVIGSVCSEVRYRGGSNLIAHGMVDSAEKDRIMSGCAAGLNPPILTGAGRNLKVLDYIAHGLPVITTPLARGGSGNTALRISR